VYGGLLAVLGFRSKFSTRETRHKKSTGKRWVISREEMYVARDAATAQQS